ncbi:hypothetical protein A3K29_01055 [Candidatus Collierbacteria bacterium RIFOXYB2_FULL_46_14]|uniref:Uncharacterized protein n=1 Tax=Candidatus Collierbacteria bacterium GW2011_GWA2_46_26 TaxID=1618381 RepID=A0A0G1SJ11_9BACT|nr:MAG: hypothetical protein UW29_C0003G0042 [Candidatus Collierbacteria bacterium GW2011_GWC2_44_13]KKU33300.1 MAG: hypothetical protein UX47_C0005G0102 [Candidatus Collierbacteria bacterium GW2011_GWA2_46_26]OGD72719.1 MAG: hypothetical protein A3K29_01055 [Candidatus Collierbacteria bacterium RIFOXYB2_FULL_46_14]OGD75761.1 MAG: hypothetical protein A3K43_01055 [Candidatus Collierbacteria bacterium RIFOXYA2_FULL_46_20]OGD77097.1 MAG: hypothetical protein A3K39_01055 [Candidatus Collierbacteri
MIKINTHLSKKTILFGTAILLPLVILTSYYLASRTSKNQAATINPEPVSTKESSPSADQNPFQNKSTKLEVNWENAKINFQKGNYPTYETTPIINDVNVDSFASILGFSGTDRKTLPDNDAIWKKGKETLLYISSENTLDYQNEKVYVGPSRFNEANLINRAKQYASNLFSHTELVPSPVTYFGDNAYEPNITNVNNSLLAQINFNQTIGGHLVIPANLKSEYFISLFITPDLTIQTFKSSPGYQSARIASGASLADFDKLKTIPANYFRKITNMPLEIESIITFSKKLYYSVSSVDIAYTIIGSKAVPVYYIDGTVYGDNIKVSDHVVYLAPLN